MCGRIAGPHRGAVPPPEGHEEWLNAAELLHGRWGSGPHRRPPTWAREWGRGADACEGPRAVEPQGRQTFIPVTLVTLPAAQMSVTGCR